MIVVPFFPTLILLSIWGALFAEALQIYLTKLFDSDPSDIVIIGFYLFAITSIPLWPSLVAAALFSKYAPLVKAFYLNTGRRTE